MREEEGGREREKSDFEVSTVSTNRGQLLMLSGPSVHCFKIMLLFECNPQKINSIEVSDLPEQGLFAEIFTQVPHFLSSQPFFVVHIYGQELL